MIVVMISADIEEPKDLNEHSKNIGLRMNLHKPKIMSNMQNTH